MGKSILIITLGVSLIISFIILKLNTNSTYGVESTMNKFDQTHARLIANSGIEIFLEKLKFNRSLMNSYSPNNILFDGTYDIWISGPDELVRVKSEATFLGVKHTSIAEALADRIPFHPGPSALYLSSGAVAGLKNNASIGGSIEINGNNHNINGNLITPIVNPTPAIGVDGPTQKAEVISEIRKQALDQILGLGYDPTTDPITPSVDTVKNEVDWSAYAIELVENRDRYIGGQSQLNEILDKKKPWGDVTNPEVTFIEGDLQINSKYTARGAGILVVKGNLDITGGFEFKGLVIAFQNTNINLQLTGTALILGSLVVAGSSIGIDVSSGNIKILYSSEALEFVDDLIETKRFEILSWWE